MSSNRRISICRHHHPTPCCLLLLTYLQTLKQVMQLCIRLIINSGGIIHLCHRRLDISHISHIIPTIITVLSRTHLHHPRLLQEQSFIHRPRVKHSRHHWQEYSSRLQHLD
ncbi:MAG: hypothetical protein ACK55Z_26145, partial [bacterium]